MKNKGILFGCMAVLLALTTYAFACDGWRRVEEKNRRYDKVDLTSVQKSKIQKLKTKAVNNFSHDHKKAGYCNEHHKRTVANFVTEADGVLTNVQRMELRTTEKLESIEKEVKDLKAEIRELKMLVRELIKQQRKKK